MTMTVIALIFPMVFMFHEFEEIIGTQSWFARNSKYLTEKFPLIQKPLERIGTLSIPAFAVAVFEEFLIVSTITILAVYYDWYYAWVAIFLAFSVHLLVHIVQWIVVRRYIPMIISSVLCLPYCIYTFMNISGLFSNKEMLICFGLGVLFMVINLLLAHKLGAAFDKWITKATNHKSH